jgi:hypothetical protein
LYGGAAVVACEVGESTVIAALLGFRRGEGEIQERSGRERE